MPEVHCLMLTYCTNIHPGESWTETFANVRENVPRVQQGLQTPKRPFPLSLWLSGRAARELQERGARQFLDWCRARNIAIHSINGFPYGGFHDTRVKENVYLPDWRSGERLAHTVRIADLLGSWLDASTDGVVSTVPVGYRTAGDDWDEASRNLVRALTHLDRIAQRTGKNLVLALEPEPGCVLETAADVVRFFGRLPLSPDLRRHLGICYDCCHQAVVFESPVQSLTALANAGIRIAQLHVTSALRVPGPQLALLRRFVEPCYLHQTVGRTAAGALVRFGDLEDALATGGEVQEWRVHFHVPVFTSSLGECSTTQSDLVETLALAPPDIPLVVETYSFVVLPAELRSVSVVDDLVRELQWVRDQVARRPRSATA